MWGEAAELVPGNDVVYGAFDDLWCIVSAEGFPRNIAEAYAMTIRNKADSRRELLLNRRESFVGTGSGDTIHCRQQGLFQFGRTAGPFCDFDACPKLGLTVVK